MPGGCTAAYQSFLTTMDPHGYIHRVHPIILPGGARYAGSLSGLAVSRERGTAWACGKEENDRDFSVFSFKLSDLDVGFGQAPLSYETRSIQVCHVQTVTGMRGTPGREACLLHWDRKRQWLWIGNSAQQHERGEAVAHRVENTQCSSGGTTSIPGSLVYRRVEYGSHVASFTFLTDVLGDHYAAIARCDNFAGANAGQPCSLQFYETDTYRTRSLTNSPTLTIRTPAGIGNIVHDTSIGRRPTGGGYMQASFVGMTSALADDTANGGGEPEDRVFVLRTPYLSTGIRKRVDRVTLSFGGVQIIPNGFPLLPFIPTRPEDQDPVVDRRQLTAKRMVEELSWGSQSEQGHVDLDAGGKTEAGRRLQVLSPPPVTLLPCPWEPRAPAC